MESFLAHLRQNTFAFYFLIIFSVLWGGGMLWGLVFLIRHLRRKTRAIKALQSMGFTPVTNNSGQLERITAIALGSVYRNFANRVDTDPQPNLLKTTQGKNLIRIEYTTKEAPRDLHRATGMKEEIQIIKRVIKLKKILNRPGATLEPFYANTTDSETIRAYQPKQRIQSTSGWVLCFPTNTQYTSTMTIHRKFTSSSGILMNLALAIAKVTPAATGGLIPEFEKEFDLAINQIPDEVSPLSESVQRKILKLGKNLKEEYKLVLDPKGVWISGTVWPKGKEVNELVSLCETLINPPESAE